MTYVDGYVLPVSRDKIAAYREQAEKAGKIWMEYGALSFKECVGDDLDAKEMVPFPKMAGTKDDETVVFSYIVYKDRQHRDEVNAKVMADPRLEDACGEGVFDFRRMAYGGFEAIVDL